MITRYRKLHTTDIPFTFKKGEPNENVLSDAVNVVKRKLGSSSKCEKDVCAKPLFKLKPTSLCSFYDPSKEITYIWQEFSIISTIGVGTFGFVCKAKSLVDQKFYAIKMLTERKYYKNGCDEIYCNEIIGKHPNCVEFIKGWTENKNVFIQMEFCPLSLSQYANENGVLFEEEIWKILHDILNALNYIHGKSYIHRDVKSANIMISTTGLYKLADFGVMTGIRDIKNIKTIAVGDSKYLARECLNQPADYSCDIFALGLCALELLTNIELPGNGDSWHLLRRDIFPSVFYLNASGELAVTVERMCNSNFKQRPSAKKLLGYNSIRQVARKDEKFGRQMYQFADEETKEENLNTTPKRSLKECLMVLSRNFPSEPIPLRRFSEDLKHLKKKKLSFE